MKYLLFVMLLSTSLISQVEAAPHSHGGRVHSHALPATGIQHRHGAGAVGQQSASKSATAVTKDGAYYYNLAWKKKVGSKAQNQLMQKACNLNYARSCFKLGARYYKGVAGVSRNEVKAVQLLKRSCDLNSGEGCGYYSRAFHEGKGVKRNYTKRDNLLRKACKLGDKGACQAAPPKASRSQSSGSSCFMDNKYLPHDILMKKCFK